MTKTRASACHGNVKQPAPFSSSFVGFTHPSPEPPPAYAHSSFLIQNEFFRHFPESPNNIYPAPNPFSTIGPSYTGRILKPHETKDRINQPINCKSCSPPQSEPACSHGACPDSSGMTDRGILDPWNAARQHQGHAAPRHMLGFALPEVSDLGFCPHPGLICVGEVLSEAAVASSQAPSDLCGP